MKTIPPMNECGRTMRCPMDSLVVCLMATVAYIPGENGPAAPELRSQGPRSTSTTALQGIFGSCRAGTSHLLIGPTLYAQQTRMRRGPVFFGRLSHQNSCPGWRVAMSSSTASLPPHCLGQLTPALGVHCHQGGMGIAPNLGGDLSCFTHCATARRLCANPALPSVLCGIHAYIHS